MENDNSTGPSKYQQQYQQLQQHQQEQLQAHEHQQQFCLRWHNHQTSLLSTLPILLDQSHLTDVTLSAEGRTLRAHRVVLSACSTFFLELFRTLDAANHPVIIIPGTSFATIVSLLTFMYSGEVNVYEEQIPMLLNLAETLGIKGLADVQNNKSTSQRQSTPAADFPDILRANSSNSPLSPATPPPLSVAPCHTPQQQPTPSQPPVSLSALRTDLSPNPLSSPLLPAPNKLSTPLENFFLKSLQFYPHLLPQPLNFSQNALNKTSEFLAKYQQQCNSFYQGALGMSAAKELLQHQEQHLKPLMEDVHSGKRLCTNESRQQLAAPQQQQDQQKVIKKIDKIVENLRCGNGKPPSNGASLHAEKCNLGQQHSPQQGQLSQQLSIKSTPSCSPEQSPHLKTKSPHLCGPTLPTTRQQQVPPMQYAMASTEEQHGALQKKHLQHHHQHNAEPYRDAAAANHLANATSMEQLSSAVKLEASFLCQLPEKLQPSGVMASSLGKTTANSKLYATCFICHKQLSNQYNLRVHLETHQNVRYACNVCSHVSRSKDALRKHVSYRHPGAPSPCETEARRKRATKNLNISTASATPTAGTATSDSNTPTSPTVGGALNRPGSEGSAMAPNLVSPFQMNTCAESESQLTATAAQLSSAYSMFMPSQFQMGEAPQQQQSKSHAQLPPAMRSAFTTSPALLDFSTTLTTASPTPANRSTNASPAIALAATVTNYETAPVSSSEDQAPSLSTNIKHEFHSPQLADGGGGGGNAGAIGGGICASSPKAGSGKGNGIAYCTTNAAASATCNNPETRASPL